MAVKKSGVWRVESEVEGRCIIIGASPECDTEIISEKVNQDDCIVCADGGYKYALSAGIEPDIIIGDFDSSEFPENLECEKIKLPVHKDDTDTMYCVRECIDRGYREFLLFGMTGGRTDHTYANFCTLLYLSQRDIKASLFDSENEIFVMTSGKRVIENKKEHIFSIFPFGCEKCTVSLDGFEYGLENGILNAEFPLGVSNVIKSDEAKITLHEGSAICMLR